MAGKKHTATRRGFLKRASLALGVSILSGSRRTMAGTNRINPVAKNNRLPREVWIASLSQNRLEAKSFEEMIRMMRWRLNEVVPFEPDIVCLPEVFPFSNVSAGRPPLGEAAEVPNGEISGPVADFAKAHHCYDVCPTYTKENGRGYNAAVFIDREGKDISRIITI